jgi:regulator of protease activity HflC (stomatin/prohibitin superfamily)
MNSSALPAILTLLTLGIRRFFIVEQGEAKIVVRFGKPRHVAEPGLHNILSLWGLFDQVGRFQYTEVALDEQGVRRHTRSVHDSIPTREVLDEHRESNILTKDGNRCSLEAVLYYTVIDPMKAAYGVTDYTLAIEKLVQSLLRNESGKYPVRELVTGRDRIAHELQTALARETVPWGVSVRLVEIKSIDIEGA